MDNLSIQEKQNKLNHTSLRGYIQIDYNVILKTLNNDGFDLAKTYISQKSKCIWLIEGEINGEKVIASIYDWKEDKGAHYINEWQIGGFNNKAIDLVKNIFFNCNVVSI